MSFSYVDPQTERLTDWVNNTVPQSVIDRANATRRGNQFTMPSGAVTSVRPENWVWACAPGIGNEASCVSEPSAGAVQYPPASGIMPAPIAPPPRVVAIEAEETERYALWSSCHSAGLSLDQWAKTLPCSRAIQSATAASVASAGTGAAGWLGCLLVGLAVCGAAADVLGGHR